MDYTTLLVSCAWLISGAASYIYWWTKHFDFTTDDIPVCVACALIGPVSFFMLRRAIKEADLLSSSHPKVLITKKRS
jgi:multisubunit Na+/H+ antiporter MnhG subunit